MAFFVTLILTANFMKLIIIISYSIADSTFRLDFIVKFEKYIYVAGDHGISIISYFAMCPAQLYNLWRTIFALSLFMYPCHVS